MESELAVLSRSRLFAGVAPEEIRAMLGCLQARRADFSRGEYILRAGSRTEALGMILSGQVLVVREDIWGGQNLLHSMGPGDCFAETFACVPGALMEVSVTAQSDCTVLFLNVQRILTLCPQSCAHHSALIRNLLTDLAEKNLSLTEKLSHLGERTTRGKLLSYLSAQAQRRGSTEFDIPFSRQQLADFLLVDRSGLSAELSRMSSEGLLSYRRNHFILHRIPENG